MIKPKASKLDKAVALLIFFLVIAPIALAAVKEEFLYALGSMLGFLAIWISNLSNHKKFLKSNVISKKNFITFTPKQIQIQQERNLEVLAWEHIRNITLAIVAYPGKAKRKLDGSDKYDGTENKVTFTLESIPHQYAFYIKDSDTFSALAAFIKKEVLPQLYALKNIKNESLLISKFTYEDLQLFKSENGINRYTDQIYFD